MKIETGLHTIITAEDGYFLANSDMSLYGEKIVLGIYDSPENYSEYPMAEWPVTDEPGDEPGEEPEEQSAMDDEARMLAEAKASKLREIDAYDNSNHVNGFYLGGGLMWLDRETRASLKNTIESAIILGRDNLDIWFGDLFITLSITDARTMLAVLEMYATDCYNVTAQHKADVRAMDNIEDIEAFDVTKDYPEKPEFNSL